MEKSNDQNDERIKNILKWGDADLKFYTNFFGGILGDSSNNILETRIKEIKSFGDSVPGTLEEKLEAIKKNFQENLNNSFLETKKKIVQIVQSFLF